MVTEYVMYNRINERHLEQIRDIVGAHNTIVSRELLADYTHDEFVTAVSDRCPQVVVKPTTVQEVAEILRFANRELIPVTPRGGGTGLCGGCVPSHGGIVLSLENMNRILEVDPIEMVIVTESGVRLAELCRAAEEAGLFFPPRPGDESAMVGGMIATNAGGARAVKYGVIRNFIRGMEVVTPTGKVLSLGGKLVKNSTGYSLSHLIIGSEGTLGVITKATIGLLPPPAFTVTLIAPFEEVAGAVNAVPAIFAEKILPMAVEFIERDAIDMSEKHSSRRWPCREGKAYLMLIIDGSSESELMSLAERISQVCTSCGSGDLHVAQPKVKQDEILEFRSKLFEPIKSKVLEILDISLPRRQIVGHLEKVRRIASENSIWIPTYGHAADGNVHSHITKLALVNGVPGDEHPDFREIYRRVRRLIHEDAKARGGMISGEHGIGTAKKEYMSLFLEEDHIETMRCLKRALDPNLILNPGKIFDFATGFCNSSN